MLYDLKNRIRGFGESRLLNVGTAKKPRWIVNVHEGDDYAETYGNDPSYAIQDGVVVFSGWSSKYGWHARYRLDAHPRVTIGHHSLEEASPLKKDDRVVGGKTFVGRGGDSASGANGNHVHIQAEDNGTPVPPRPFIAGAGAAFNVPTGFNVTPFDPQKDTRTIMALKDTLTIYSAPGRGYLVVGPSFTREIIGNERLNALTNVVGIEGKAVGTREWDVIAEFFRGNDELQGRVTSAQVEQAVKGSLALGASEVSTDELVTKVTAGVRDLFAKAGS